MDFLRQIREKWSRFILGRYDGYSFYERRKAEYSSAFMLLLLLYIIPTIIIDFITTDVKPIEILSYFLYYLIILTLIIILRTGKIKFISWALTALGCLRGIQVFFIPESVHFYSQYYLVVLAISVIFLYRIQTYFIYTYFNILLICRPFIVSYYIRMGRLPESAFTQTLYAIASGIIFTLTADFVTRIIEKEIHESQKLEALALTDPLTGLANRRKLEELYTRGLTSETVRTMMIIDLDLFKSVNDDFGHEEGDRVLKEFSVLLDSSLREGDSSYRWGGEEFIAILTGQDLDAGLIVAGRILETVSKYNFGIGRQITVSIGLTEGLAGDRLDTMFSRADKALYRAKSLGRNRIEVE